MIVIFIYGSTIWSIFPITELIDVSLSWEAHLSGAISGLIVAFAYRKHGPQKPKVVWDDDDDENEDKTITPNVYIDWENVTYEYEDEAKNNSPE